MGPDNLELTRFSSYKLRSSSAKGARGSAPIARIELKLALTPSSSTPSLKYISKKLILCESLVKKETPIVESECQIIQTVFIDNASQHSTEVN
ncbi:hypothetical protein TNCV_4702921 [Trichonephila clavipes]|nr:hypothetical protein TNCV_4702921 [Trichonephila clavipes]